MLQQGILFIISAPSGGGKTTLVRRLIEHVNNLEVSISYTTRPKRNKEVDGIDYHFIDTAQFEKMEHANEFIEHANVFGHLYGTSRKFVNEKLAKGIDIILEIDWQGAAQARKLFSDQVSIFILPPSRAILEQRLRQRETDTEAVIERRLSKATQEMQHAKAYDYLVVNDQFDQAFTELSAIILSQRLRYERQAHKQADLLMDLLNI